MTDTVKLRIQLDDAASGPMKSAAASAAKVGAAAQSAQGGVGGLASALSRAAGMASGAVAGLGGMLKAVGAVDSAARSASASYESFDEAMRKVNTMAGLGEEDFAALAAGVKGLGREVPKARDELAQGLYQVISNGVPRDNWLSFLEASARSSVGGVADLGQAVTVTSTLIKNYGATWESAAAIQDRIQLTAQNGVTSFEDLAAALPGVSGSAATLGVSIDELLASFATLTGVSGNTSAVSTQLAAVMNALVKPTAEAARMADEMGVRFDAAAIKAAGGFGPFLASLKRSVAEYSAASGTLETEVYGRLFGSAEALRALIPLQGEMSAKYAENVAAMSGAGGTMDAAFGQMASTGRSAAVLMENLRANIMDAAGAAASFVAPAVGMLNTMGQTASSVASVTAALGPVAQALGRTAAAQRAAAAAARVMAAAQRALNLVLRSNPVGIAVTALAALSAAVVAAYRNCEGFRAAVDKVWGALSSAAQAVWRLLKPALDWLAEKLSWLWDKVSALLGLDGQVATVTVRAEGGGIEYRGEAAAPAAASAAAARVPAEPALPPGSLAALKRQIEAVEAKIEMETDGGALRRLGDELRALQRQKDELEERINFDAGGPLRTTRQFAAAQADMAAKVRASIPATIEARQAAAGVGAAQMTAADKAGLLGRSFEQMGASAGGAGGAMLSWAGSVLSSIAQVMPSIAALVTAKTAEGIAGATASGSVMPFPYNLVAISAGVAAVLAALAQMPAFAEGGIAYGPTLGLFGEYAGARSNPEVVAPLSRLRSMLSDAPGGGRVSFKIEGRRLVGVLAKEQTMKSRR